MKRVLLAVLLMSAMALLAAGCQTQNPFAAVGPATVPAPSTGQTLPYYPPNVTGASPAVPTAANPAVAVPASAPRVSVSAEGTRSAPAHSAIVADPADREPIRIVENGAPAARTASANARGTAAGGNAAVPAPAGAAGQPQNRLPIPAGPASGKSGYAPPGSSPATSRMRGFAASSEEPKSIAGGVAPASYQQPVPTFSEATAADGQWRAR